MQGLGGHAQGGGQPVVDLAGVGGVSAAAGDAVVRAKPQPRSEVLGARELLHVGAYLAKEGQGRLDADAFHRSQIDAELFKEFLPHRLVGRIGPLLGARWSRAYSAIAQSVHFFGDLRVALGHLRLVKAPRFQRLAQREEMLLAPVTFQGFGDFGLALLAAVVAQAGERLGVALSCDYGIEDRQAGKPGDVGDGVV